MPTQAFKVQRGTTTIATSATTATITAGTDYTAPSSATAGFIRIASTRYSGMGPTSGGGTHTTDRHGVHIQNPGNITTSITFERQDANATYDCRVSWEIIEYVGSGGGANEMIVRGTEVLSGTGTPLTGTTLTNITDANDVAVIITGQASENSSNADHWEQLWVPEDLVANGGNWDPRVSRLGSTAGATVNVSIAVVEFTGSNWTVDRFTTDTTGTTWSPGDSNNFTVAHGVTISDVTKAFAIAYYATDNDPGGIDDAGDAVSLDSTTNLRIYNAVTAGTRRKAGWIIQNSQSDGTANNLSVQHHTWADDTTTGSEERVFTETGFTAVADIAETSVFVTCSVEGGGAALPRGYIDYRLTATGTLTLTECDNGQERRFAAEIVEWPEDPDAGSTPTLVTLIT